MATMVAQSLSESASISLTAGQTLQVQILNPNGTVAQVIYSDTVPSAVTFNGTIFYSGQLS